MDANKLLSKIISEIDNKQGTNFATLCRPDNKFLFDDLNYRYFGAKIKGKQNWQCCWSITKNENGKYVSWVYVEKSDRFIVTKAVEHKKHKDAKTRALKLYNKRKIAV